MQKFMKIFSKKRILIVGIDGKSGRSVLGLFLENKLSPKLCDEKPEESLSEETYALVSKFQNQRHFFAENLDRPSRGLENSEWELVIISPGVPREKKYLVRLAKSGVPIWSEVELAYNVNREPPIGITGTDGKSTTTTLTEFILNGTGLPAVACGNIGLPYLEIAKKNALAEQGRTDTEKSKSKKVVPVVELSSYQLESISAFNPLVGALLNINEDHVDRYPNIENYLEAKLNLFSENTKVILLRKKDILDYPLIQDFLLKRNLLKKCFILPEDKRRTKEGDSQALPDLFKNISGFFFFDNDDLVILDQGSKDEVMRFDHVLKSFPLAGLHNRENLAFSLALSFFYTREIQKRDNRFNDLGGLLKNFKGLPHRFEVMGRYDGVQVINDSKATTFQSTEMAVLSQEGGRVVLIAGGRGKGSDFADLAKVIAHHIKALVLLGETSLEMDKSFKKENSALMIKRAPSMIEAVKMAKDLCEKGDTLLLSPGCASFDMFRDFEERGDEFRRSVIKIFK